MFSNQNESSDELQLEREFQSASDGLVGTLVTKLVPSSELKRILEEVKIQLNSDTKSLRFDCPSGTVAAQLFKMSHVIALAIYGLRETLQLRFIPQIEIFCTGQQFIPRLNPEKILRDSLMGTNADSQSFRNLGVSELDLNLNELYGDRHPIYITQMSDQKVLFANRAALMANNRNAGEMVGKEVTPLWDDDILVELMNRLQRDGELWQYSYPGYRWSREPGSPIWRRERFMFTADYKMVEFLGSTCRFCVITGAEKTSVR
jgi:hypothetical protein